VKHSIEQMVRQSVYAVGCGEEDLNAHDEFQYDIALQTAALASPSRLGRFENSAQRLAAVAMNAVHSLICRFAPTEIILDFDVTDDVVHGNQDGRFFMGTTITTVSFRSTSFAVRICSVPICVPRKSMGP
jgi:hypothetical protein